MPPCPRWLSEPSYDVALLRSRGEGYLYLFQPPWRARGGAIPKGHPRVGTTLRPANDEGHDGRQRAVGTLRIAPRLQCVPWLLKRPRLLREPDYRRPEILLSQRRH